MEHKVIGGDSYGPPLTPAEENARLRDQLAQERKRSAALLVDAGRREERARKIAEDCAEHGKEIQYLRHLTSWYWAAMVQQEDARWAIVAALLNTVPGLSGRTEPVPAGVLAGWLQKAADAQQKVLRRPAGYPTLADCLLAGGCDHDGLSDEVKAEIAEVLGISVPAAQGVLFEAAS